VEYTTSSPQNEPGGLTGVPQFVPHWSGQNKSSGIVPPQQYLLDFLPPVTPLQSLAQLRQSSPRLQTPSLLQAGGGHTPQSPVQLEQLSDALQVPSPHTSLPVSQSSMQVSTVSSPLQLKSPQYSTLASQSAGQL
jgi:hypothetical protein